MDARAPDIYSSNYFGRIDVDHYRPPTFHLPSVVDSRHSLGIESSAHPHPTLRLRP